MTDDKKGKKPEQDVALNQEQPGKTERVVESLKITDTLPPPPPPAPGKKDRDKQEGD